MSNLQLSTLAVSQESTKIIRRWLCEMSQAGLALDEPGYIYHSSLAPGSLDTERIKSRYSATTTGEARSHNPKVPRCLPVLPLLCLPPPPVSGPKTPLSLFLSFFHFHVCQLPCSCPPPISFCLVSLVPSISPIPFLSLSLSLSLPLFLSSLLNSLASRCVNLLLQ